MLALSTLIGAIGSMLGIGGGIFLVPLMTLGLGINVKVAAATSLVTIIVTSSTSSSRYLGEGYVNISLGMFLELFTVSGAIAGAILVAYLSTNIVAAAFGAVLIYAAFYMRIPAEAPSKPPGEKQLDHRGWSRFDGAFTDASTGKSTRYQIHNLQRGAGASLFAGVLSGLVGIGGGIVKVPAMNLWMGVPIKAATATSNFVIGVTAVASTLVYLSNGLVAPVITADASIGIFIGAIIGSSTMKRMAGTTLKSAFAFTMLVIALLMFARAAGWL